jgi:small-conductance mechanosensitive channel/CRP-like cAMP-binding protein
MDAIFHGPLRKDLLVMDALGVLLALALIAALRATLAPTVRARKRTPGLLLAAHFVMFVLSQALPEGQAPSRIFAPLALLFLLLSIGRSAVVLGIDVFLGRRMGRPLPRIIRDILQGLVVVGIGLVVLNSAGVEPGSLLTTSALLTAVIGLSLQDTLGNVFAGLAIQVQQPFEIGDWIQFDNEAKNVGRVIEINWRATKVITLENIEVTIPNGSLAKAPIRNFTKPTMASRRSVFFQAPYSTPPDEVHRLVLAVLADTPGVLLEPPPSILTNQFADSGIEYWVRFFTEQFHRRDAVDSGVRDRIWHALQRGGVEMPFPHRVVQLHTIDTEHRALVAEGEIEKRGRVLRGADFFRVLSDGELIRLAKAASARRYAAGEVIMRQGDTSRELFVIDRGEVAVLLARPGETDAIAVARLGPGSLFGEMALVTGDQRQATVRAVTACELVEVGPDAMQGVLATSPDLAERISAVLAERQAALDLHATKEPLAKEQNVEDRKSEFLVRMRKLFSL